MRSVKPEMWEDDFFASLNIFSRLLWIGIITACADDQGRFQDNPNLIRAKIFPYDDIPSAQIEGAVKTFETAGKITRYKANGKSLIQIVNWWKHQNSQWAGKSLYPPPDGWTDRERYHAQGNRVVINPGWSTPGGYLAGYLPTKIDANIELNPDSNLWGLNDRDGDVNGDVNGDGDSDEAISQPVNKSISPSPLSDRFTEITKIFAYNLTEWVEASQTLIRAGVTVEELEVAIKKMQTDGLTISGLWSVVKPAISVHSLRAQGKPVGNAKPQKAYNRDFYDEDNGDG